jgi:hypothetical protein
MNQYKQSEVEVVSVKTVENGDVHITYRPRLESLYYSPGVNVEVRDGRAKLSFIRCQIADKCKVAYPATNAEQAGKIVKLPGGIKAIDAVFSDGEQTLL